MSGTPARASTRQAPIVPLPPDDAWHQGGDGGHGHPAWEVVAAMSGLSEDVYCATWMHGLEHELWAAPDRYPDGRGIVDAAKQVGVWWYYLTPIACDATGARDPGSRWGPWPVSLDVWAKMLAAGALVGELHGFVGLRGREKQ